MIDDEDLDYLTDLEPAEFEKLILSNLTKQAPARLWDALCHPDLLMGTTDVLRATATTHRDLLTERRNHLDNLARSAATSPEGYTEYRQAKTDYAAWHPHAAAFQRLLERRLWQAKAARRDHHDATIVPRELRNRTLIRQLAEGINEHRQACRAADLAAEPHDEALWRLLDEIRLADPDGHDEGISLAEMLVCGPWSPAVAA